MTSNAPTICRLPRRSPSSSAEELIPTTGTSSENGATWLAG